MRVLADQAVQCPGWIGLVALAALVDAKPIAFFDEQIFKLVDPQCDEGAEVPDGLGNEHPDGSRLMFDDGRFGCADYTITQSSDGFDQTIGFELFEGGANGVAARLQRATEDPLAGQPSAPRAFLQLGAQMYGELAGDGAVGNQRHGRYEHARRSRRRRNYFLAGCSATGADQTRAERTPGRASPPGTTICPRHVVRVVVTRENGTSPARLQVSSATR